MQVLGMHFLRVAYGAGLEIPGFGTEQLGHIVTDK